METASSRRPIDISHTYDLAKSYYDLGPLLFFSCVAAIRFHCTAIKEKQTIGLTFSAV